MRSLCILVILLHSALASEPLLKSTVNKTFTPDGGQAFGDIQAVVCEWQMPTTEKRAKERSIYVRALRTLSPDNKLRYWTAVIQQVPSPEGTGDNKDWFSEPRISRAEFVALMVGTEAELKKLDPAFHLRYILVGYHVVEEHENELTPKLKKALAETKGEVEMKHRGIMNRFYAAFFRSQSIELTSKMLRENGLNFQAGGMVGDYYSPVDRQRANTWKKASELPDLGLNYPPSIQFERGEGEAQPATKPADKVPAKDQPSTPTSKDAPR